jgi:hypothetical protein
MYDFKNLKSNNCDICNLNQIRIFNCHQHILDQYQLNSDVRNRIKPVGQKTDNLLTAGKNLSDGCEVSQAHLPG